MRRRELAVALLAAGVALCAAGCSGGSSSPSAKGSASASPLGTTSTSPSPSPSGAPSLDPQLAGLVLPASEVATLGTPVETRLYNGGNQVAGEVTLDACNGHFPSESKRVARIQVGYIALTGRMALRQIASNEVVRYAPGGTTQAYRELQRVAAQCPSRVREGSNVFETQFTVMHREAGLGARQLTVTSLVQAQGTQVWTAATYLYRGDLFDGIYVFGRSRAQALTSVRQLAHIAERRLLHPPVGSGLSV